MKSLLSHGSRYHNFDGWALRIRATGSILRWTLSTTRQEVRDLRVERGDLFTKDMEVVKVRIRLEVVG